MGDRDAPTGRRRVDRAPPAPRAGAGPTRLSAATVTVRGASSTRRGAAGAGAGAGVAVVDDDDAEGPAAVAVAPSSSNAASVADAVSGTGAGVPPPAKRKRVSRACQRCRSRKQRCSGTQPCALCVSASTECVFPPASTRRRRSSPKNLGKSSLDGADASVVAALRLMLGATTADRPITPVSPEDLGLLEAFLSTTNRLMPLADESLVRWHATRPEAWITAVKGAAARASVLSALAWAAVGIGNSPDRGRSLFYRSRVELADSAHTVPTTASFFAAAMMSVFADQVLRDSSTASGLVQLALRWRLTVLPSTPPAALPALDFVAGYIETSAPETGDRSMLLSGGESSPAQFLGAVLGCACRLLSKHSDDASQLISDSAITSEAVCVRIVQAQAQIGLAVPVMAFVRGVLAVQLRQRGQPGPAVACALDAYKQAAHVFEASPWSPSYASLGYAIAATVMMLPGAATAHTTELAAIGRTLSACASLQPAFGAAITAIATSGMAAAAATAASALPAAAQASSAAMPRRSGSVAHTGASAASAPLAVSTAPTPRTTTTTFARRASGPAADSPAMRAESGQPANGSKLQTAPGRLPSPLGATRAPSTSGDAKPATAAAGAVGAPSPATASARPAGPAGAWMPQAGPSEWAAAASYGLVPPQMYGQGMPMPGAGWGGMPMMMPGYPMHYAPGVPGAAGLHMGAALPPGALLGMLQGVDVGAAAPSAAAAKASAPH